MLRLYVFNIYVSCVMKKKVKRPHNCCNFDDYKIKKVELYIKKKENRAVTEFGLMIERENVHYLRILMAKKNIIKFDDEKNDWKNIEYESEN